MIVVGLSGDFTAASKVVNWCLDTGVMMLDYAALLLKQVDYPTPFLCNRVIRAYEQSQNPWDAIHMYKHMLLHKCVYPDKFSYPFVLKACVGARALEEGEKIHCRIIKSPLSLDLFVKNSLIFMYAKCGNIDYARVSFDATTQKDLISWNTMIDGYVKHGDIVTASNLFDQMPERDLFSWNVMIDGYAKCGKIDCARRLFDEMPEKDTISWNSMIDGYSRCGDLKTARILFDQAPIKNVVTCGIMLNGLVECGQIGTAHSWFEKMSYKNLVMWNSLISGYVKCGDIMTARKLFDLMPCRNSTSWNIMLDAYAKHEEMELAYHLFHIMPMKDVVSWNILMDGYSSIGRMNKAREIFDTMPCRDVVSWNTMIAGYKYNGEAKEAVEMYFNMLLLGGKPNCFTVATILSVIADLGFFVHGREVHAYIVSNKFPLDGIVGVALMDMYSKCGYVDAAIEIFNSIPKKSKDHWNAMISGLAIHGYGSIALSFFQEMEHSHVVPDEVTFIALLNACSHAGLVHEGYYYFDLMRLKYSITPKIQHFGCMVDLLSRAGHLEVAVELVNNMPVRANDVVWRALLGASRNIGNREIAEHAARHLIELVPEDSSSYVLLSNIYGYKGKCDSARNMWKIMKERGVIKSPGCSSIELQGIYT